MMLRTRRRALQEAQTVESNERLGRTRSSTQKKTALKQDTTKSKSESGSESRPKRVSSKKDQGVKTRSRRSGRSPPPESSSDIEKTTSVKANFITSTPRPSSEKLNRRNGVKHTKSKQANHTLPATDETNTVVRPLTPPMEASSPDTASSPASQPVSPTQEMAEDMEMETIGHTEQSLTSESVACMDLIRQPMGNDDMDLDISQQPNTDTLCQDALLQSLFSPFSPAFTLMKRMPYDTLVNDTQDTLKGDTDAMDSTLAYNTALQSLTNSSNMHGALTVGHNYNMNFTTQDYETTTMSLCEQEQAFMQAAAVAAGMYSMNETNMITYHNNNNDNNNNNNEDRQLVLANHTQEAEMVEEDELDMAEMDPYIFIATVPPVPREYQLRPFALPRKTRSSPPITLVLDLDETLVHCSTVPIEKPELEFPVEFNGRQFQVHGRCRPHYREFLERVADLFEVVVFTASQRSYADRLLDIIDPQRKLIKYRLFRDSCVHVCGNYLKDLTILGRDLAQVVIVDNAPQAFAYQLSNGIPIESWYDNPADRELINVLQFLETLVGKEDVRPTVEKRFRMHELIKQAQMRQFSSSSSSSLSPLS